MLVEIIVSLEETESEVSTMEQFTHYYDFLDPADRADYELDRDWIDELRKNDQIISEERSDYEYSFTYHA